MKKLFIAASLIIGMIAGAMVLSSFSEPKQEINKECTQFSVNDPVYWEGEAKTADYYNAVYIKVYQTSGQCNSYYAVTKFGEEFWVKENPDYDPDNCNDARGYTCTRKYYVTIRNINYYFNM